MRIKLIKAGRQMTLKKPVTVVGKAPFFVDLDVRMKLFPAKNGVKFFVGSRKIKAVIPATIDFAGQTNGEHTTLVAKGNVEVKGIEHLLSALAGLGIGACDVRLSAGQVPVIDASAETFCKKIVKVGVIDSGVEKREAIVNELITFADGLGSMAIIRPAKETSISALIQFEDPIGEQYYRVCLTPDDYLENIAWARSFIRRSCDEKVWEICRRILPGLPEDIKSSPVMVFESGKWIVGPRDKRQMEPVRHKILDAIGDLSLLGYPLRGEITLIRPGHDFNRKLVGYLAKLIDSDEGQR